MIPHRLTSAVIFTALLCSCSMLPMAPDDWSYRQPPRSGAPAGVPSGGVWCDDRSKAVVMATTGFFVDGCESILRDGDYKVISVEHIAQNDVRSWVVKIGDASGHVLWIPLPDHNWA